ncbi:MAG: hypothetical protein FD125_1753 [bacterium]|nr:MAG: hypothetical protein FD125_1753 [bacterium]
MTKFVSKFMSDESGATAIEYGLIAALIGAETLRPFCFSGPEGQPSSPGYGQASGKDDRTLQLNRGPAWWRCSGGQTGDRLPPPVTSNPIGRDIQ